MLMSAKAPEDVADAGRFLEALGLLYELGAEPKRLASSYGSRLADVYPLVRTSSEMGRWSSAVIEIGGFAAAGDRKRMLSGLLDAVRVAASRERFDIMPDWSWNIALGLAALAYQSRGDDQRDAIKGILRLTERTPGVAPAILKAKRRQTDHDADLQQRLVTAFQTARTDEGRDDATLSIVAWCQYASRPSTRMWELLIAALELGGSQSRVVRRHLQWFGRHGRIPRQFRRRLNEVIMAGTENSQPTSIRVSSLVALWPLVQGTSDEQRARERIAALLQDPIAIIRRAAEHAWAQLPPPTAKRRRKTVSRARGRRS